MFNLSTVNGVNPMDVPASGPEDIIPLDEKWRQVVAVLDFAFQPIVNYYSGSIYAVEALVRNSAEAGFRGIFDMFDQAYRDGVLYSFDLALRDMAVGKFSELPFHSRIKLFYNYDPRVHEMPDYSFGHTERILDFYRVSYDSLCFELSEQHRISSVGVFGDFIAKTRGRGFKIAMDDFGAGFAGYELFYHSEPDFLKVDRFLISGIDSDMKKKTFCSYIIGLAKFLGVVVIAEGIETESEFLACRDLGFDLMQGYFVSRPVTDMSCIQEDYQCVRSAIIMKRRGPDAGRDLIGREIMYLDPISVNDPVEILFKRFNRNSELNFFPVLDTHGMPLGIIHERSIKKYIYSPFGYDLLHNTSVTESISTFIETCPVVDESMSQEKILEIVANSPELDGVIVTSELKYRGFLSARSILKILNESNLAYAREVNPLTKLPGNILISRYITVSMQTGAKYSIFFYFDFNNFKPFNDKYGFRKGDRVIMLFADILQKEMGSSGYFIGHVGGDDFFAACSSSVDDVDVHIQKAVKISKAFSESVTAFYDRKDIESGYYLSVNRGGVMKRYPLLSVSSAVLRVSPRTVSEAELSDRLAEVKGRAKLDPENLAYLDLVSS